MAYVYKKSYFFFAFKGGLTRIDIEKIQINFN